MTMTMSNLPNDLVEEIVSRVPLKFMKAVRLTCKKWKTLFESRSFTKMLIDKEEASAKELGETRMIVVKNYNVYLMSIVVNEDLSIKSLGKLTCLHDSEQVKISEVFHCEGLLLCILKDDDTKIVVWNPYLAQTRWIQTRKYHRPNGWKGDFYMYALGYKNNSKNKSPKILRFIDDFGCHRESPPFRYEIYDFDSDIWTTLDVSPYWRLLYHRGLSLKGNSYWGTLERNAYGPIDHIICFDFTRERFGPLLPLPFRAWGSQFALLSSRDQEKIVAVFQSTESYYKVEVWITTKIDAKNVSWSNFFTMNMSIFAFNESLYEEKKVAAVLDMAIYPNSINIIGEAGRLKTLDLGEPADKYCWLDGCTYVPSIVQIKRHNLGGKRKKTKAIRKGIYGHRYDQNILRKRSK